LIFNSVEFLLFFPLVFVLYWFVFNKNLKNQNLFILISSYVFYGWWDYRFLSLIFLSTIVDYLVGLNIPKQDSEKKQKLLLWCSVIFNLGVLGFFKYYNFFIESWIDLFSSIGYDLKSVWTLNIILPVGISFYTFQTMSYTIDIYRKKLEPTKDFISFSSFISFFPQLVAGPVERATNLLPQILKKREFNYEQGVQGLLLILWGMFKKVVIADSLAPIVNEIFENYENFGGGTLWLGAIYFSFQIYCDFSGYSDIAIGTSKLLGVELMTNFNYPLFSRNISEFWRRWHISMTSWFTDYIYYPLKLKFRDSGASINLLVLVLYFFIIGFWHGANWTYIMFGLYHCLFFVPTVFYPKFYKLKTQQIAFNKTVPSIKEFIQVLITFIIVTIGFVFFRSETIMDSFIYLNQMFFEMDLSPVPIKGIFYILILIFFDYRFKNHPRKILNNFSAIHTRLWILLLLVMIVVHFSDNKPDFIYFQF